MGEDVDKEERAIKLIAECQTLHREETESLNGYCKPLQNLDEQ